MSIIFKIFVFIFAVDLCAKDSFPIKSVPMCRVDLNRDKNDDLIFLTYGWRVFVILSTGERYNLHLIKSLSSSDIDQLAVLSCHKGSHVFETSAGPGKQKRKKVEIQNGFYFKITWPESSSIVYFWKNDAFRKVWTAD